MNVHRNLRSNFESKRYDGDVPHIRSTVISLYIFIIILIIMGKIEDGCLCIQCGPNGTQLLPLAMAATVIKTMSAQDTIIFITTMTAH